MTNDSNACLLVVREEVEHSQTGGGREMTVKWETEAQDRAVVFTLERVKTKKQCKICSYWQSDFEKNKCVLVCFKEDGGGSLEDFHQPLTIPFRMKKNGVIWTWSEVKKTMYFFTLNELDDWKKKSVFLKVPYTVQVPFSSTHPPQLG